MSWLDLSNILFHVSAIGAVVLMAYAIGWDHGYKRANKWMVGGRPRSEP